MHQGLQSAAKVFSVAVFLAGLTGCGGDGTAREVAAMNKSNVQRLANMYSAHQNYKSGRGPRTEAEFREFIAAFDSGKLNMMGIKPAELDALFKSERDGKPFKIRYDVGGGRGSVDAVVFEQDGQGGKRQVGFTGAAKVDDVDTATYEQLLTGKAATEPIAAAKGGSRPTGPPPGAPTGPAK